MNAATLEKLRRIAVRAAEIQRALADPKVIAEQNQFRKLSIELAEISPLVEAFSQWQAAAQQVAETQAMRVDADPAIRQLAKEELPALETELQTRGEALQELLAPADPNDRRNVFLEIRAGTGGDEAALFAGDLFKMYFYYAEACGFSVEIISRHDGEYGGHKEIISRITAKQNAGARPYAKLKFESGAHRVQRVPQTESQGRVHTSTCTVAVLAEPEPNDEIEVNPSDLRVDTFRASGAGGQHVNKTDSAIRITHLPSSLVVECQDQRSQHKNRARALAILTARLAAAESAKQQQATASARKSLVGSGARAERIRTYNFPQGRLTDHRIGLTLYKLEAILAGDLDPVIAPLAAAHHADLLSGGA